MEVFVADTAVTVAEDAGSALVLVKRAGDLSVDAYFDCYTTSGKMNLYDFR